MKVIDLFVLQFFSLASIVVKLFNLICVMVLMGHWSGCIQFFVPVIQGLPQDSWIVLNNLEVCDSDTLCPLHTIGILYADRLYITSLR